MQTTSLARPGRFPGLVTAGGALCVCLATTLTALAVPLPASASPANAVTVSGQRITGDQTKGACGWDKSAPGVMGYSVMDAAPTGAGASFGIKDGKVTGVMITGPATDKPLRFWNYNWMVDSGGGAQWTPLPGGGRVSGLIVPIQPGGAASIGPPASFEIVITDCTASNNPQFTDANPSNNAAIPGLGSASPPTGSGFTADWTGTWHSGGAGGPATVHLVSADPIVGSITIPGWCTADWQETQRFSATSRVVRAHVTSGSCGDNTWAVTFEPNASLTGIDNQHPGTTFSFSPS